MDILVVKTGALGDVLRTTVILEGLAGKYSNPRIHWLTSRNARPLLENNILIERLFLMESPEREFLRFSYNLIISLEEDKELLEILSEVKGKRLFGLYLNKRGEVVYTSNLAAWYDMSLKSRFGKEKADMLKKSNILSYPKLLYKSLDMEWLKQQYRIFPAEKDLAYSETLKGLMPHNKPVIGIVVGSGARWPMKILPPDRQIALIEDLHKKFGRAVNILLLIGVDPSESAIAANIKKKCPYVITHDVQELAGFIGIVHLCDIVVTPDTLSMHISIALSKYTIAYFTVTSAAEIELYKGKKVIAKHPDYCTYTNELKSRPNITDFVSIEKILSAIEKLINNNN